MSIHGLMWFNSRIAMPSHLDTYGSDGWLTVIHWKNGDICAAQTSPELISAFEEEALFWFHYCPAAHLRLAILGARTQCQACGYTDTPFYAEVGRIRRYG